MQRIGSRVKGTQRVGSRAQVMHGNAKMTGGGLKKKDLKYNKQGKIVSKKMSAIAKKEKRLQKAGYTTRKGQFGAVRTMRGGGDYCDRCGFSISKTVINCQNCNLEVVQSVHLDAVELFERRQERFSLKKKSNKEKLNSGILNKFESKKIGSDSAFGTVYSYTNRDNKRQKFILKIATGPMRAMSSNDSFTENDIFDKTTPYVIYGKSFERGDSLFTVLEYMRGDITDLSRTINNVNYSISKYSIAINIIDLMINLATSNMIQTDLKLQNILYTYLNGRIVFKFGDLAEIKLLDDTEENSKHVIEVVHDTLIRIMSKLIDDSKLQQIKDLNKQDGHLIYLQNILKILNNHNS